MKNYFVIGSKLSNTEMKPFVKISMKDDDKKEIKIERVDGIKIPISEEMFQVIIGKGGKELLLKTDGYEYLNNLRYQFSGSYFRCGEIQTEIVDS